VRQVAKFAFACIFFFWPVAVLISNTPVLLNFELSFCPPRPFQNLLLSPRSRSISSRFSSAAQRPFQTNIAQQPFLIFIKNPERRPWDFLEKKASKKATREPPN
jgi:hypothetical protein